MYKNIIDVWVTLDKRYFQIDLLHIVSLVFLLVFTTIVQQRD